MKKTIVLALLLMFAMPVMSVPVFSAEEITQPAVVNVENKLCPVSGDPVSGSDFVEYQGKRYSLCCPACKSMFLADPEKYIAKMKGQEQGSSSAATVAPVVSESEEMEKGMEQGEL